MIPLFQSAIKSLHVGDLKRIMQMDNPLSDIPEEAFVSLWKEVWNTKWSDGCCAVIQYAMTQDKKQKMLWPLIEETLHHHCTALHETDREVSKEIKTIMDHLPHFSHHQAQALVSNWLTSWSCNTKNLPLMHLAITHPTVLSMKIARSGDGVMALLYRFDHVNDPINREAVDFLKRTTAPVEMTHHLAYILKSFFEVGDIWLPSSEEKELHLSRWLSFADDKPASWWKDLSQTSWLQKNHAVLARCLPHFMAKMEKELLLGALEMPTQIGPLRKL